MSATGPDTQHSTQDPPSRTADVTLGADFDIIAALGGPCTCLFVGTGGTVITQSYNDPAGTWRTRKNVPAGSYLTGRYSKIRSTANGTTAADIIAETHGAT